MSQLDFYFKKVINNEYYFEPGGHPILLAIPERVQSRINFFSKGGGGLDEAHIDYTI